MRNVDIFSSVVVSRHFPNHILIYIRHFLFRLMSHRLLSYFASEKCAGNISNIAPRHSKARINVICKSESLAQINFSRARGNRLFGKFRLSLSSVCSLGS